MWKKILNWKPKQKTKVSKKNKNIIISGGGTGGHVFPAISIANAIKEIEPESNILFVGALGKIEMEKVPAAGYQIIGLPIAGLQRRITYKNIVFIFKLTRSLNRSKIIIKKIKPDVVVGVGGYASGPVLYMANRKNIPTLIQEQNSYAGITNKLLAKKAQKICVAYEGMEKYFPAEKIILTGNPIRQDLLDKMGSKTDAAEHFKMNKVKKTVLVIGGSLGARTINQNIMADIDKIGQNDIQILWQTGKYYYEDAKAIVEKSGYTNIKVLAFIVRMDYAYSLADVIISRAGAGTISELCLVGKPVVLVPSPNVAEDHQTKNAMALVNKNAAVMVKDNNAKNQLVDLVLNLIHDNDEMHNLSENIKGMALRDSAKIIAKEVLKLG